jgi:hypothetical protein
MESVGEARLVSALVGRAGNQFSRPNDRQSEAAVSDGQRPV